MKWVLKTSSVRVATRENEAVYRSFDEVPAALREEIREALSGPNTETIYIANQEAYERIKQHQASKSKSRSKLGAGEFGEQPSPPATRRFSINWKMALAAGLSTLSALALLWLWLILNGKS